MTYPIHSLIGLNPVIDYENGPERLREAIRTISDPEIIGVNPFTDKELRQLSRWYTQDLKSGLKHDGTSSLLMADTLLPRTDKEKLPKNEKFINAIIIN